MPTLDEIGQERQRLAERLAKIEAEREKVAAQLNELEVAERVFARFGGTGETSERRRRGRPARQQPAAAQQPQPQQRRGRGGARPAPAPAPTLSLSEATLQAVRAHPEGVTANEILNHLSREFGLKVRPNHLGIALQRHRRGGRLETRDSRWFLPQEAHRNSAAAEHQAATG
jgi:transposase